MKFSRNHYAAFCLAFFCTLWAAGAGFLLFLAAFLVFAASNFLSMRKTIREDFDDAKTPWATISASFGWTHSAKVAGSQRPIINNELERIMIAVMFGFGAGALVSEVGQSIINSGAGQ